MKILFLDVDGVLNNNDGSDIQKSYIYNLASIINSTSAKVVLSSSWREFEDALMKITTILKDNGIEIYESTPFGGKGRSIKRWLESTSCHIDSFVVIDDDYTLENYFDDHFCLCRNGLNEDARDIAINILNGVNHV